MSASILDEIVERRRADIAKKGFDFGFDLPEKRTRGNPVPFVAEKGAILEIKRASPSKGDTSGKSLKPATLDTGAEIRVPLFCNTDDRIVIDTREGTFVERAKDK